MNEEAPMCCCGKAATIRTSWTDSNPGRRFSMCAAKVRETKKGFKGCQFWAWFDPAMCERSKAVIPGLLKSRNKLEKSVAKARQREKLKQKLMHEDMKERLVVLQKWHVLSYLASLFAHALEAWIFALGCLDHQLEWMCQME
ncbi:unnamed protein product [Prunus brigantina]